MKRGFVTLATGKEQYYKVALNLLKSYKYFTSEPLPFAIVCDKENSYTEHFDDVILIDNVTCSYMDKLSLIKTIPYEETVFIDADCLAYGDLNPLFDLFEGADDISCFGKVVPIDSSDGYFKVCDIGEYEKKVSYSVGMHGGIMYFKKSDVLLDVYDECCKIAENYGNYKFKYFEKPADEPIIALSMAVHGLRPITEKYHFFSFYPVDKKYLRMDILNKKALVKKKDCSYNVNLVHFGGIVTQWPVYITEERNLKILCEGNSFKIKVRAFFKPYVLTRFLMKKRNSFDKKIYNLKCKLKPILMRFLRRG